jgi:tetrahydromethanopterin S-methyltransferase subunit H
MFSFTTDQKIFEISGIKFGGQPGKLPTVLIGGIFFKGLPDFEYAKKHLSQMYEISRKTGNPAIPDFFIKKEEYVESIINFIDSFVPIDQPFSIDIIESSIKLKALEALNKKNLLSRTIYNSIHIGIKDDEREAIIENKPEMAIVVAFNPKEKSPDGKIEVLENGANLIDVGLLELSKQLGFKKILIDTAALAPGENSGASIAAIPVIKEEYGLPTGCAIHNVVEKSSWLNNFESAREIVDSSSNINIPVFGGDYAIFGPIENAKTVFPIISWEDILISEYTDNYFGIFPVEKHPRRILLK